MNAIAWKPRQWFNHSSWPKDQTDIKSIGLFGYQIRGKLGINFLLGFSAQLSA